MSSFVRFSKVGILVLSMALWVLPAWGADFIFTAIPDQDTARLQERFGKIAWG